VRAGGGDERELALDFRLYLVRVFVTDFERAIEFYTETLGIPATSISREMGWAQLETGEAQLAIERTDPEDPENAALVGRFVGVSLEVGDIAGTYEQLLGKGVTFEGPPERQPWGGILAHLRDPDGNVLTLLGSPDAA
jgi:predicted enzyme related to lactoylglutathione lyase